MNESPARQYITVALVCVLVVAHIIMQQRGVRNPAQPPGEIQSAQLLIQARYALGLKSLRPPNTQAALPILLKQITDLATSPEEQICTAILTAEIVGADDALELIAKLQTHPDLPEDCRHDLRTLTHIYDGVQIDADTRATLIQNRGWFGEIALTHGLPEGAQARRQVMAVAQRTFVAIITAGIALLGVGFLGLLLFIAAVILSGTGKLPRHYQREDAGVIMLEVVAACLALLLILALVGGRAKSPLFLVSYILLPAWPFLWLRLRGVGWGDLCRQLGWHTGKGLFREVGCGLVGYLAGLPIIAVGILITVLLSRFAEIQPSHPIVEQLRTAEWLSLSLIFALACIIAPIFEETMFRGAFYRYLRREHSVLLSAGVTGVIFAAIHPQGWTAIPALGAIGLVFALLREWRGSLIAPAVAHALNNFAVMTMTCLFLR